MRETVQSEHESVCVVGLGTVGAPTAEYFLGRGIPTYGCDLDPIALGRLSPRLMGGKTALAALPLAALPLADAYIMTVDTSLRSEAPFVENVFRACEAVPRGGRPGSCQSKARSAVRLIRRQGNLQRHERPKGVHLSRRFATMRIPDVMSYESDLSTQHLSARLEFRTSPQEPT